MIASDIKMTIGDGTCIGLNQNPNKIHATNALLQRNNLKIPQVLNLIFRNIHSNFLFEFTTILLKFRTLMSFLRL